MSCRILKLALLCRVASRGGGSEVCFVDAGGGGQKVVSWGDVTAMDHHVTDGSLFLFVNRKRDRIKALRWETGGLTLWCRRLEQGTVELPQLAAGCNHVLIENVELAMWISGVDLWCVAQGCQDQTKANGGVIPMALTLEKTVYFR